MDQNIIILVLILIAILVSFYATYLSMDNSRKIRRLQNDIREALGNINSTLNLDTKLPVPEKEPKELPKRESRTDLQDLDQFPSLEEIENYDNEKIMEPIDPELKKELDEILLDNNEGNEKDSKVDETPTENTEEEKDEVLVEENSNILPEPTNLVPEEVSLENENVEVVAEEPEPEALLQSVDLVENNQEKNDDNQNTEEAINSVVETENIPDMEPISLSDANLLQEIEALCPENRLQTKTDDTESVVESVMGEAEKKQRMDNLPSLEELSQEVLQKMHDKNVKLICKREGLKVRGTKVERIDRILEAKEFKINVN